MPLLQPAVFQIFPFSYENDITLNYLWKNRTSSSDKYAILRKPFLGVGGGGGLVGVKPLRCAPLIPAGGWNWILKSLA